MPSYTIAVMAWSRQACLDQRQTVQQRRSSSTQLRLDVDDRVRHRAGGYVTEAPRGRAARARGCT